MIKSSILKVVKHQEYNVQVQHITDQNNITGQTINDIK